MYANPLSDPEFLRRCERRRLASIAEAAERAEADRVETKRGFRVMAKHNFRTQLSIRCQADQLEAEQEAIAEALRHTQGAVRRHQLLMYWLCNRLKLKAVASDFEGGNRRAEGLPKPELVGA